MNLNNCSSILDLHEPEETKVIRDTKTSLRKTQTNHTGINKIVIKYKRR